MSIITIYGEASKRSKVIEVSKIDLSKDLLTFLHEKSIPIASSCRGMGSCCMCRFNETELTCQNKVSSYLNEIIRFDYL